MSSYPRHRERNTVPFSGHDAIQTIYQPDGTAGTPSNLGTYECTGEHEVMDDVVIDDFRRRIAAGEIINNPCSYVRTSVNSADGSVRFDAKPSYPSYTDFLVEGAVSQFYATVRGFSWADKWPSLRSVEDLTARAKLLAIANLDSTPYAFGEDTLEIRETLRFLRNPLEGILKATRSFTRKIPPGASQLKAVKRQADAVTNLWLEYEFAAAPLYRSLCDALEAYVIGKRVYPVRLSSRGFADDTGDADSTWTWVSGGSSDSFEYNIHHERELHAGILYEVSNPIRDWRFNLGFRMKDLPTTFWQIVPLSFMLDRVYDVTSFSKGVINMADPKVKILSGFTRVKENWDASYRFSASTRPERTFSGDGGKTTWTSGGYHRTPWVPSLRDTVPKPHWQGIVDSATKVLDLGALIYGHLSGKLT